MKVRSAHPSYAQSTAMSATPNPPQEMGESAIVSPNAPSDTLPSTKARIASPTSALTVATVDTFCTIAPHATERMLAAASSRIAPAATIRTAVPLMGTNSSTYSAKSIAIAPSAEGRMTRSSVQPNRKAGNGPYASRRKT